MIDRTDSKIAIYWDFENLHISIFEDEYGPRSYLPRERQPDLVDIDRIMDFASSLGSVCVNRAYCNWAFLDRYADALGSHAIQLVQMWPRSGKGKNGADIQMCVDIMEDLQRLPHVDTFILISGDSDFLGVLSKLKQHGKRVIGIGAQDTTHRLLIEVCDEFKFYHSLLSSNRNRVALEQGGGAGMDPTGAKQLLCDAMQRLTAQSGMESVKQVVIKPAMLRLYSAFDERTLGFLNFSAFLDSCGDVIEISKPDDGSDRLIKLRNGLPRDRAADLESARKLLVAGMTFLTRRVQPVALASLKPMLKKLDRNFDETKLGVSTFIAFVRLFPNVVAIEGEPTRHILRLLCEQDEGGYPTPPTPSIPTSFPIPPCEVLEAAHQFHWAKLQSEPAADWENYFVRLSEHLSYCGITHEEQTLKAVQNVLRGAKVLRPRTDNAGITLRPDFTSEEEFRHHVHQFVSRSPANLFD